MSDASLDRSTLLGRAVAGATGLLLGGTFARCGRAATASGPGEEDTRGGAAARRRVLIAYFSRAGENYYYGGRRNLKMATPRSSRR